MTPPRFLVTGGAGFIGSRLVRLLLAEGAQAVVLDDLSAGRAARLPEGVRLVQGDVRDPALLARLAEGCDAIFHLAAVVSVQDCIHRWSEAHQVNLGGAIAVLQAAHAAGNVPVVQASSAAVYGRSPAARQSETDLPRPISPYGADKLAAEHHAAAMAEIHGLPSVALRFFNVYGPGQDPASPYAGVIARFLANRRAGRAHEVYGDGTQSRDFIHVDDVARALLAAQRHLSAGAGGAGVFNICTGQATSLLGLMDALDAVAARDRSPGAPGPRRMLPARAGDILHSLGRPDAAHAALGFTARVPLSEGLAGLWQAAAQAKGSAG